MDGELEQTQDGPRLRFERRLAHSPAAVWRALTEPSQLAAWFPDTIVVPDDWAPGATLRFEHPGGAAVGEVLAVEDEQVLEFTWGPDVLRFELEPDGDGTILTLLDTLEVIGKAARDGAGWHVCLEQLRHHLDGSSAPAGVTEQWLAVHPVYVDRFGPEAATIGPPEGALG